MAGCLAQWPARALRAALVGVLLGAGTHAPAADSSAAIAAFRAGDHGRAVAELRAPAAAGDPAAQFYLGLAYAKGWGVVADAAKARHWYEQAAQAGTAKAQVNLALLLLADGDADGARVWLERAARQGDGHAAHRLGLMYYRGQGVARDFAAAREWWQAGAARGDAPSAFNLGLLYRNGLGVERDAERAQAWWQQAARGGLAAAQNALGAAYQHGDGVPFDLVEAWAWFRLAAEGGLAVAAVNADLVRSRLDQAQAAHAHARLDSLRGSIAAPPAAP